MRGWCRAGAEEKGFHSPAQSPGFCCSVTGDGFPFSGGKRRDLGGAVEKMLGKCLECP